MQRLIVSMPKVFLRQFCSEAAKPVALRSFKKKSSLRTAKEFIDIRSVRAIGGKGGDGCISFLQLWSNENAGPDGGDGGSGGHVILQVDTNVRDLDHVSKVLRGEEGEKGYNKDCHGKNAPHTIIKVPVGTTVRDTEGGRILGDLKEEGAMFVLARGGAGGRGNSFFASDTSQSPEVAECGADGERLAYVLELRSIAHFGLVGFPNAGKSSLLQAISRARPKVAPYPFTTLKPHLGIIPYSDYAQIAVADLPGLIEGSHKNRGLGIDFLRHTERCAALVIVIDLSDRPLDTLNVLRSELTAFSAELAARPQLIVGNKIDLPDAQDNLPRFVKQLRGEEVIAVSAKFGTNLTKLLNRLREKYDENETPEEKYPT